MESSIRPSRTRKRTSRHALQPTSRPTSIATRHIASDLTRLSRLLLAMTLLTTVVVTVASTEEADAAHSNPSFNDPGCNANALPANDDGSTGAITLPFTLNFFGSNYDSLFVNNNGNVTFGQPLSRYTPFQLAANTPPIIAPFFGDVDTEAAGSSVVTYGQVLNAPDFGGRDVFCVNWTDVGYFQAHDDKLNDFQLLLVERNDVDAGDFDIYFNYERILWETGDASGGFNGFGGSSAGAGYAAGTGSTSSFFELPCSRVSGACLDSDPLLGLHNTSTNSSTLGRHIFSIRSGGQTFTGSIFGNASANGSPVSGAFVQVCRTGAAFCAFTTFTNANGDYTVGSVGPGPYNVSISPPGNLGLQSATVNLADGEQREQDFVFTAPQPPPPDVLVNNGPPGTIPIVVVGQPFPVQIMDCAGATVTYEITQIGVPNPQTASGSLTEGPAGTYTANVTVPFFGEAVMTITIGCPDDDDLTEIEFNIYIDPSGFVRTVEGEPIVGATVTLFRSDTEAGPFTQVPDGSVLMSPSNRVNPDVTDATGHFGWDVVAGFYYVRAEAEDCTSPDDPSQAFVDTEVLTIPPPVTDLDIRLDCDDDGSAPVSMSIDDTARGDADRARITGSITCPATETFLLTANLINGDTTGSGRATGTCTGDAQRFSLVARRISGPGFNAAEPAEACITAKTAAPGSRAVNHELEVCGTPVELVS